MADRLGIDVSEVKRRYYGKDVKFDVEKDRKRRASLAVDDGDKDEERKKLLKDKQVEMKNVQSEFRQFKDLATSIDKALAFEPLSTIEKGRVAFLASEDRGEVNVNKLTKRGWDAAKLRSSQKIKVLDGKLTTLADQEKQLRALLKSLISLAQ
jgi:hypothetical protein